MSNHLAVAANRDQLRDGSERVDRLRQRRLLVGGLVLVDDALGDGLVELARRGHERDGRGVLVATGDGLADPAHVRAELGLDCLVAQPGLLVGADALELGLDVRHVWTLLCVRRSDLTGRRGLHQVRDWGVGYPRRGTGRVPPTWAGTRRSMLPARTG